MTIVRINKQKIEYNQKNQTNEPVIIIDDGINIKLAHQIEIEGPSQVVYKPNEPLDGGTTCYITTNSNIKEI